MTPSISFSHMGIHCRDLDRMHDFYTRVMGMSQTDRGSVPRPDGELELIFLSSDPKEHHQLVLVNGRKTNAETTLLNQIAFRVATLADLRALRDTLAAEGVDGVRPINHGTAWSIYFPDPEGNTIEAFVDSPWYVRQPLADPLDLSQSDAEIVRGTAQQYGQDPSFMTVELWRESFAAQRTGG